MWTEFKFKTLKKKKSATSSTECEKNSVYIMYCVAERIYQLAPTHCPP